MPLADDSLLGREPFTVPAEARSLTIVVSLLHPGYLRHFGEPFRLLAAKGHKIQLVFEQEDKDGGDRRLLQSLLTDAPSVSAILAPKRSALDGWRPLAWASRLLLDVLRYSDPEYARAIALKRRATKKLQRRIDEYTVTRVGGAAAQRVLHLFGIKVTPMNVRRVMRALRVIEDAIPPSRLVLDLLSKVRPDLVIVSPVVELGSAQVEFVKAAHHAGIPCAVFIASWDNLTNKGVLKSRPDRVFVWNDIQQEELTRMHDVSPDRIVVTGGQKFDPWFSRSPATTAADFAASVHLDPQRPYLLYVCSSPFVAPDEVSFVLRWIAAIRGASDPELRGYGILVRPHPQNAAQWDGVDTSSFENVTVWPPGGEFPDDELSRARFFDSLAHAAGVVGVNTSALIEAAIAGSRVYTVHAPEFVETQVGTLHYHYLRSDRGGFLHEAATLDQHLDQLAENVNRSADESVSFLKRFVRPRGLDQPVAPIVAAEIEALALAPPSAQAADTTLSRVVRLLLYPIVSVVSVTAVSLRIRARLLEWMRQLDSVSDTTTTDGTSP